jgi:hypothetical protein
VLALMPVLLLAQAKVRLEFSDAGQREVWFDADWPTGRPLDTQTLDGAAFDVPAKDVAGKKLFIWDRKSGNVAVKPSEALRGLWKVAPTDFQRIGAVTLKVMHGDEPVAAAQVIVRSKGFKHEDLLDPSSKGEVALFGVPPGDLEVQVKYKVEGETRTRSQKFPLSLKRDEADPVLGIAVVDNVETVAAPKESPKGEPGTAATKKGTDEGGSLLSLLVTYVLAIGLAVGAGYVILHFMRQNKDAVQQKLESLGVQMPDPDGNVAAAAPVVAPRAPEPPQKIILDDAAPIAPAAALDPYAPTTPDAMAPLTPAASPMSSSPRLVGEDGRIFDLQEGLFTVGRDDGLPISLTGESTVSRQHAEVTRSGGEVSVTDLGSTNGTYVNGQKVQAEVTLRPGDTVQFGAVRFRYEA